MCNFRSSFLHKKFLMKAKPLPDYEYLNKRFFYESETGKIYFRHTSTQNKAWNTKYAWKEAGYVNQWGYLRIGFNCLIYPAHRIAWKLYHEVDSALYIDHINCNKVDNRITNLREATPSQSSQNRKNFNKKLKGVSWVESRKRYMARIRINGKIQNLGRFKKIEDAHNAYCEAAKKHFGEFVNLD